MWPNGSYCWSAAADGRQRQLVPVPSRRTEGDSLSKMVDEHSMRFRTRAIHVGNERDPQTGAVVPPIHVASTYVQAVAGEWGDRFGTALVGRVCEVTHRFCGSLVSTMVRLTSPYRSVSNPLDFLVRSQTDVLASFALCLDDGAVGLDLNSHLD